ncbi:hypothetical protein BpHYR1_027770, partial [Brachionus plicatilis]
VRLSVHFSWFTWYGWCSSAESCSGFSIAIAKFQKSKECLLQISLGFFLAISSLFCKLWSSAQFPLISSVYFSFLFWSFVSVPAPFWSSVWVSASFGSSVPVSAPFGFSVKDSVKSGGSVHLPFSVAVSGILLRSNLRFRLLPPFISPIRRSSPLISPLFSRSPFILLLPFPQLFFSPSLEPFLLKFSAPVFGSGIYQNLGLEKLTDDYH